MEWLRRIIRRILGKPKGERGVIIKHGKQTSVRQPVGPPPRTPAPRRGIRSTDLGIRKLRRHRGGRQYDLRSGFDPRKRMVDIEDGQTRKPTRKKGKRGWAEDR